MKRLLAVLGLVALASACDSDNGTMRVAWQQDTTSTDFALPAHAVWCLDQGWLEVVGARSDTGVAMALFLTDTVIEGRYPIVPVVERADTMTGVAAAAVRWFSEDELLSFEGVEGEVEVVYSAEKLDGRFQALLEVPVGSDSLLLEGDFKAVAITRGGIECRPVEVDSAGQEGAEVLD